MLQTVLQKNQESDREIADRMMKTAAVLSVVTAKRGGYSTIRQ
jgi:hypothetical protein